MNYLGRFWLTGIEPFSFTRFLSKWDFKSWTFFFRCFVRENDHFRCFWVKSETPLPNIHPRHLCLYSFVFFIVAYRCCLYRKELFIYEHTSLSTHFLRKTVFLIYLDQLPFKLQKGSFYEGITTFISFWSIALYLPMRRSLKQKRSLFPKELYSFWPQKWLFYEAFCKLWFLEKIWLKNRL